MLEHMRMSISGVASWSKCHVKNVEPRKVKNITMTTPNRFKSDGFVEPATLQNMPVNSVGGLPTLPLSLQPITRDKLAAALKAKGCLLEGDGAVHLSEAIARLRLESVIAGRHMGKAVTFGAALKLICDVAHTSQALPSVVFD